MSRNRAARMPAMNSLSQSSVARGAPRAWPYYLRSARAIDEDDAVPARMASRGGLFCEECQDKVASASRFHEAQSRRGASTFPGLIRHALHSDWLVWITQARAYPRPKPTSKTRSGFSEA
jgi:hypothetical protein